jgi:aspartate dehydrogenase
MVTNRATLRVGIVGLGTVGRDLCRAIDRGEVEVQLVAVNTRDHERTRPFLETLRHQPPLLSLDDLIARSDLVIEAATQAALETIAPRTLAHGKDLIVLSVGGLLDHHDWVELAAQTGSHIYVPSGAIVGLDGVKGAAIGPLTAVTMTTRKPPRALEGAPFVVEHHIDLDSFTVPTLIFEGDAREACRGFPANVNISAALSLAGIGPDRTHISILVDPNGVRNVHDIEVVGEFGRFSIHLENEPSETNPRTGKLTSFSTLALLKTLTNPLTVGT